MWQLTHPAPVCQQRQESTGLCFPLSPVCVHVPVLTSALSVEVTKLGGSLPRLLQRERILLCSSFTSHCFLHPRFWCLFSLQPFPSGVTVGFWNPCPSILMAVHRTASSKHMPCGIPSNWVCHQGQGPFTVSRILTSLPFPQIAVKKGHHVPKTRDWVEIWSWGLHLCITSTPAHQEGLFRVLFSASIRRHVAVLTPCFTRDPTWLEDLLLHHPVSLGDFEKAWICGSIYGHFLIIWILFFHIAPTFWVSEGKTNGNDWYLVLRITYLTGVIIFSACFPSAVTYKTRLHPVCNFCLQDWPRARSRGQLGNTALIWNLWCWWLYNQNNINFILNS